MTNIQCIRATPKKVSALRDLFLREGAFQFVYDKCHGNGWADIWIFLSDGEKAGYGAVWGAELREDRDAIFEFFLTRPYRVDASRIFREFVRGCGARLIECQTNDALLTSMLYEYAYAIHADAILFEEDHSTHLSKPDIVFGRQASAKEHPFDVGGYYLDKGGDTAATGGFMLNYNFPFADIYIEVMETYRQQGYGSLMVQELKREIYRMGRIPAARCHVGNAASKATLLRAGFRVCGAIVKGFIHQEMIRSDVVI